MQGEFRKFETGGHMKQKIALERFAGVRVMRIAK